VYIRHLVSTKKVSEIFLISSHSKSTLISFLNLSFHMVSGPEWFQLTLPAISVNFDFKAVSCSARHLYLELVNNYD